MRDHITIKSGHYKLVYNFGLIEVWDQFPGAHKKIYEFPDLDDLVNLLKEAESNEGTLE